MDFNSSDVEKLVNDIGFEAESVTEIEDGSDLLYLVDRKPESLVAKFRYLEQLELSWFQKEPLIVEKVAEATSLPVPEIVHYDMSSDNHPPFFIMKFIEGETLAKTSEKAEPEAIDQLHFEAGRCLGILHDETEYEKPGRIAYRNGGLELKEEKWHDLFESMAQERTGKLRETQFAPYADEIEEFFQENMGVVSEVENFVLCHDDYRPGNILVKDGKINAIIDWARAFAGDPLYDLVNSGFHFDSKDNSQIPNENFLRGYETFSDYDSSKLRKQLYLANSIIGQMIGFSTIWGSSYPEKEQQEIASKLSNDLERIIR